MSLRARLQLWVPRLCFGREQSRLRAYLRTGTDYYDKLGVVKIINAAGVFTTYTGSTMPEICQLAVDQAALHPVHLIDLR